MPLNVDVARRIVKELGNEVPVRGALTGPCSLAAGLMGAESFMLLTLTDPAAASELLAYCAEVAIRYGRAFIQAGCGVVIFDSQASPELLSPDTYRNLVVGPTAHLIGELRKEGVPHIPLIIGGNTTEILEDYLQTGANNILCDVKADPARFLAVCSNRRRAYRRNIDSSGFLSADLDELVCCVKREVANSSRVSRLYSRDGRSSVWYADGGVGNDKDNSAGWNRRERLLRLRAWTTSPRKPITR